MKKLVYILSFLTSLSVFSQKRPASIEEYKPFEKGDVKTIKVKLPFERISRSIQVKVIDGLVIFQGDIVLGKYEDIIKNGDALAETKQRWNCSIVPYEVTNTNATTISKINQAITYVNTNTNVRLIPRTTETEYIKFVNSTPSEGNWSWIGKISGQSQEIHITDAAPMGTVVHEITHALGFYHEHTRRDRDNHVQINWNNIDIDKRHNFDIADDTYDVSTYDYGSIMHYNINAFSINADPTITILNPLPLGTIVGQRTHYTSTDIASVNVIYRPQGTSIPDDLIIRDTPDDLGNEPNTISNILYQSQDIWVRNNSNIINQHQNPIASVPNTVFVKVTNRGWCNNTNAPTANLKVYWAKAGLGLAWPNPWTNNDRLGGNLTPASGFTLPTIPDGESQYFPFTWTPENPNSYVDIDPNERTHFCLLARLTPNMTFTEGSELWLNVKNNNNIAWKNVQVIGHGDFGGVLLANPKKEKGSFSIRIHTFPENIKNGTITLQLGQKTAETLSKSNFSIRGLKDMDNINYLLTSPKAQIQNIVLEKDFLDLISIKYSPNNKMNIKEISVYIELLDEKNNVIGGENMVFSNKKASVIQRKEN